MWLFSSTICIEASSILIMAIIAVGIILDAILALILWIILHQETGGVADI